MSYKQGNLSFGTYIIMFCGLCIGFINKVLVIADWIPRYPLKIRVNRGSKQAINLWNPDHGLVKAGRR